MPPNPGPDRALSETVTIALILLLVVAIAVLVFVMVSGYASIAPKSAYIVPRGSAIVTNGTSAISLFHVQGDPVNLNRSLGGSGIAPVSFNLRTPSGSMENVAVSPLVADNTWNSGDGLTIYKDASGYWVADNITNRNKNAAALGPLVNLSGGNYTVNIVDQNAGVLVAAVPVLVSGDTNSIQYTPGLIATYYNDEGWSIAGATTIAKRVYFADAASGRASDISNWPVGYLGKAENFSVKFDGFFRADTEGDYTFTLSSDDGSYMDLNGTSNFISNGGLHAFQSVSATKHLIKGYHPVTIRMYEHTGAAVVYLNYTTPPMTSPAIVTQLYHIPSTAPMADFTGLPGAGSAPLTVQFADASVDATSWSWDFGDSSGASHAQNPSHTYASNGKYTVTLVATNPHGSNTAKKIDYITVGSFVPGFNASYYRGQDFTDLAGTRVDSSIQFTDQGGSTWPVSMVGRQENFSVIWDGYVYAPSSDTWTFYLNSDDGSRLWLDDSKIIDNWDLHAAREYSASSLLSPGYHHVVVRMYENTGVAVAQLHYSNASISYQYVTEAWHM